MAQDVDIMPGDYAIHDSPKYHGLIEYIMKDRVTIKPKMTVKRAAREIQRLTITQIRSSWNEQRLMG